MGHGRRTPWWRPIPSRSPRTSAARGAAPLKTKRKLYALWGNIPDYFAPAFETETAKRVKKSAKLLASRYCIGAFVDNEISWQRKPGVTALAVLSCPAGQPAENRNAENAARKVRLG